MRHSQDHSPGHVWVNTATFDDPADAEKLKSLLTNLGFDAQVKDERRFQRLWFAVEPQGGVHVRVRTEAMDKVEDYFNTAAEARPVFERAIRCPSCKSSRVHYPAMTRKNVLPTLIAQALVMLGVQRHEFYCMRCHFTWERSKPKATTEPKFQST